MRASLARVALRLGALGGHQVVAGEGETDGATCAPLEGAMHGPCVAYEVRARPRMARKEIEGEHAPFESIARAASGHEVAGIVRSAARQRDDMIERRTVVIEAHRAIHAALTAVTERGPSHGLLFNHMSRHVGAE